MDSQTSVATQDKPSHTVSPRTLFGRRKRRGVGILDGLMYMIFAGIVISGVLALFRDLLTGNRLNDTQQDILAIQGKVQELYSGRNDYGNNADLTTSLIQAQLVPSRMISGTTIRNVFGGTIIVTGTSTTFTIAVSNLPKEACTRLMSRTQSSVFLGVQAGGGTLYGTNTPGGTATNALPPTLPQAQAACSSDQNTITWTSF